MAARPIMTPAIFVSACRRATSWGENKSPLPITGIATFWDEAGERIEDPFGVVEVPREPAALPRRLGGFPFWRGESPFLDTLGATYAAASPRGLDVFLGPTTGDERAEVE